MSIKTRNMMKNIKECVKLQADAQGNIITQQKKKNIEKKAQRIEYGNKK